MPEQFNGKVCIIGAGCSGFTTAKRFKEFGIDYDHFEASDDIGGNWYHKNPKGCLPAINRCTLTLPNTDWPLKIIRYRTTGPTFPTTANAGLLQRLC